jgi:hypothetical protein
MLWGLVLLIVPWISYRQLIGMEQLLIQGSRKRSCSPPKGFRRCSMAVKTFSTTCRCESRTTSRSARPLQNPIRIDGKDSDWEPDTDKFIVRADAENNLTDGGFKILLGERGSQLYAFMRIRTTCWSTAIPSISGSTMPTACV